MAREILSEDAVTLPSEGPHEWGASPLGECCQFVRDGDWIETKDQGGSDYRLLQVSNIGVGEFVETGKFRWIAEEAFRRLNCTEIQQGDVLVARMPDPTGRAWYVNTLPWPAVTAVDVAILRTRGDLLDPHFLAYYLNSPACLGHVQSLTTGTTRLRIRRADIERMEVPLPSLPEQRAIAHILGTLDDKIALNRRMSETLELIARALFKSWFVDFDPVRAKAEGRNPGLPKPLADLFPDRLVDSELGEIPEEWEVGCVGDECELTMGQSPPGDTYNEAGDGLPFYQGRADFGPRFPTRRVYCTAPTRLARAGDTLVSVRAPVGDINMATEDCAIGRGVAAARHKSGSRSYTYQLMRGLNEVFERFEAEGTVFGSIGKQDFHAIPCVRPPRRAISQFESMLAPLDNRIDLAGRGMRTLTALRDTLLPWLISGAIRIGSPERFLAEVGA